MFNLKIESIMVSISILPVELGSCQSERVEFVETRSEFGGKCALQATCVE